MLIIPLGHDKGIYRFPLITAGIMVSCLVAQIYTAVNPPRTGLRKGEALELARLTTKIWHTHGQAWLEKTHPHLRRSATSARPIMTRLERVRRARREFFVAYESGQVVPQTDPQYRRWMLLQKAGTEAHGVLRFAYSPHAPMHTTITYAFLHGGWLHLIFNMLFLYLCGCNLEDRWGRAIWLGIYLAGSVVAALSWRAMHPKTGLYLVGASGAVATAMGAFFVVLYSAKIRFFYTVRFYSGTFSTKAYWVMPLWFLIQLMGVSAEQSGMALVAHSAHVGGFLFGLVIGAVMRLSGLDRRLRNRSKDEATEVDDPKLDQAYAALESGNRPLALGLFEGILRDRPSHLQAKLELYRLREDPAERAELAPGIIRQARQERDWSTALAVYGELPRLAPETQLDDRTLFSVGECFEKTENPTAAIAAFQQLTLHMMDSPLRPKALLNLGRLYALIHETDSARNLYAAVIEEYPDSAFAEAATRALGGVPHCRTEWGEVIGIAAAKRGGRMLVACNRRVTKTVISRASPATGDNAGHPLEHPEDPPTPPNARSRGPREKTSV